MNITDDVKTIVCDPDNLYKAMLECKSNVMWKDSVARFVNNGLVNIGRLADSHKNGTYNIDEYRNFIIHEPKTRAIVSTRFKDRVFQRSLCDNYLYEAITRSFVYDNCACQTGKGTDFARNRLKVHLQRYYRKYGVNGYVLKIDLKNFFGSTPHNTVKAAARRQIADHWAHERTCEIIDSYVKDGTPIGMGLGSQVTQLLQLLVLSDIDHYIKEKLLIKYYVRYMDDILIIDHNKQYLETCLRDLDRKFSALGLTISKNKTHITHLAQGIKFLGFTFSISDNGAIYMKLGKDNIKKRKRKLRKYANLVSKGKMSREKADKCYEAWKAHASKGNTYKVLLKMDEYYSKLWEEQPCSNS